MRWFAARSCSTASYKDYRASGQLPDRLQQAAVKWWDYSDYPPGQPPPEDTDLLFADTKAPIMVRYDAMLGDMPPPAWADLESRCELVAA